MAKFDESRPSHEVHEVHRPEGHGYLDQKHAKGMRSPIVGSVPTTDAGVSMPAAGPGMPTGEYGSSGPTGN